MLHHDESASVNNTADARVLGRLLAAQNVPVAFPDVGTIVEFYTQALKDVPGIAACKICLGISSSESEFILSSDCARCELTNHALTSSDTIAPIESNYECILAERSDIRSIRLDSYEHSFGYFVIRSEDLDEFSVYQPFIGNLANHVAILLENRMQQDQLRRAHDELERDIELRTHELLAANEQLAAINEELRATNTELADSQALLAEAFELNQKMLSATTLGVAAYKATGECVIANKALEQMIGATQEQLRKQNFREIASWRTSGLLDSAEKALATGSTVSSRIHIVTTFGKEIWLDCCFASFLSHGEKHLLVTAVDVSEQVAFAEALQASEDQLRTQFDLARDAILVADADSGVIIQCNRQAERLLGRSRDEIIGMHQSKLHPPEMLAHHTAAFAHHVATKGGEPIEAIVLGSEGRYIPVEINSSLLTLANGRTVMQGIFRDITERRNAEAERLAHLRFFENMDQVNRAIRRSDDIELMLTDVLDILLSLFDCDRAWLLYPCDPEAATFHVPMERTRPEYPGAMAIKAEVPVTPEVVAVFQTMLDSNGPTQIVPTGVAEQFNYRSQIMMAIYPRVGKPWVFGLHQCTYPRVWTLEEERLFTAIGRRLADALTSLLAFQHLQSSEKYFRSLYESAPLAYQSLDISGCILNVNNAWLDQLGYTREAVIGKWIGEFLTSESAKLLLDRFTCFKETGEISGLEFDLLRADGTVCHASFNGRISRNEKGEIECTHCIFEDITERKQAEIEIARNNRALRMLSDCNQALIRLPDETQLLNEVCRIIVEVGGYRMAWVGFADYDEEKAVHPVAYAGFDSEFITSAKITWADTERGRGPVGSAIRTGKPCVVESVADDPNFAPWREAAIQRGYNSVAVFPLQNAGQVFGALGIYSTEQGVFNTKEADILSEMSGDLAYGITALRTRVERERREALLQARLRLSEYARDHTLDELLTKTLDEGELLTGSSIGFFHFVEADQQTLWLQTWSSNTLAVMCTAEGRGTHYSIDQAGVWVDCAIRRCPVIHNDYANLPHKKGLPPGHAQVVRELTVPVIRNEQVVAIMGVGNKVEDYTERDAELFSQLASLAWDIVVGRRAEIAVRESEARLKEAQRISHIGSWELDLLTNTLIWSDEIFKMFEIDKEFFGASYEAFLDAIHPDDREYVNTAYSQSLATREPYGITHRLLMPDGRIKYVQEQCETYYSPDGKPLRSVGTVQDITERKQAEEVLRESQQRYRDIFDNTLDGLYLLEVTNDGHFRTIEVNPALEQATGISRSQSIGKTQEEIVPEGPARLVNEKYRRCVEAGQPIEEELELELPSGRHVFHSTLIPARDETGRVNRIIGISRDITELKLAEQERLAHLRFIECMDQVNQAIQKATDIDQMTSGVLDVVLDVLACDRAFLMYPCDPAATTWNVPMERSKPEYPGVLNQGLIMPMDEDVAQTLRILLDSDTPVKFGPGTEHELPKDVSAQFGFKCFMSMAIYPKVGSPWQFGIHQCSYARNWTPAEERLLLEIGRRLSDGLTRMLTLREIQESENKYRTLIHTIRAAVVVHGADSRVLASNAMAQELLGLTEEQMLGKAATDQAWHFFREDGSVMPVEEYPVNQVLATRQRLTNLIVGVHRPNHDSDLWMLVNADPIINDRDELTQVIVTFADITERKQANETQRNTLQKLEATLDALPDMLFEIDRTGQIIDYRAPYSEQLYAAPSQFLGKTIDDVLPQPAAGIVNDAIARAAEQVRSTGAEYFLDMPTGRKWYELSVAVKGDPASPDAGYIALIRDTSWRKQAEEAVRTSEASLNEAQRVGQLGSWDWNAVTDTIVWSEEYYRIYGFDPSQPPPGYEEHLKAYTPESAARLDAAVKTSMECGLPYELDLELAQPTSTTRWVTARCEIKLDADGQIVGLRGTAQDISERKRAEEALRRSEERYRSIVTTTTDGIWIVDLNGVIRDVNDSYCKLFGYSRAELIGSHVSDHDMREDQSAVARHNERIMQQGSDLFETRHRTKDGKYLDLEVSVTYMPEDGGLFYGFIRDITQRKQMEAQLRQAQKIEALGTLAGGIAHDFNNLLFAILGNAELIDETLDPASQNHENMISLINAGNRARDLVQQILAFSRKSEVKYEEVDVGRVVVETLHMLKRAVPSSIEFQLSIEPVRKHVMADSTEIQQVCMNLCMNSAQAMESNPGVLKVTLREVELDSAAAPRYSALNPGAYLELVVSDSGPGISAGILPKVFDPYFTTKEKGRGTGLGLAVVHGIIMRLGGAIWLDSQEGQGTRATVLLPAVEPQRQSESAAAVHPPKLNGRILVVDDEQDNLELMRKMLLALGCEVTCCHAPVEAVQLVRERPGSYSAVITDQTMPQLSGIQLAQTLREVQYTGPVILYTGYGDTIDNDALQQVGVTQLLSKPLNKTTLAQALQQVLPQHKRAAEPAGPA